MAIKAYRILILLFLAFTILSCQKAIQAPEVGKAAPAISAADLNGNMVTLESLKGKVVLINLWSYT
jgi:hypothetical protein